MTNKDKRNIEKFLNNVANRLEGISNIAEKRVFLQTYLKHDWDYISILLDDKTLTPESDEIDEIITENYLKANDLPKIFCGEGYEPWLANKQDKIDWKYYDRYESYLLNKKGWDWNTVASINNSTSIILDHLADPKSGNYFGKQGLVIGDIQSGKTANYTGLINRALDAGYKVVIILAGLTRDLRNQTQRRIDREVLGYETKNNQKGKTIGVGLIDKQSVQGVTYADEKKDYGDFKKTFQHLLTPDTDPLVAIVKKNKSVLTNLKKFLTSSPEFCYDENKKLIVPVLIIDDEVDQASVDTKSADILENASAINKGIREILNTLSRYAYVGYTATPFANIFIDPDKYGDDNDLYPRDFILCLETPRKYCGIKQYFGVDIKNEDDDDVEDHNEDLFRNIDDEDHNSMYKKSTLESKNGNLKTGAKTEVDHLSNTLERAIRVFILGASIKKARGIEGHNSMLIHLARYKNPSTTLKPKVQDYVNSLYHEIMYEDKKAYKEYEELWKEEFYKTSQNWPENSKNDNWNKIKSFLLPTINSILQGIRVVNGDLNEQVDYEESNEGDYIVIGGDKLSRGLTLEGLLVSYYYRRSKMYDSLLQMGRWFGYRDGWIDLCRVYTTVRVLNDFIYAGKALERFKQDINDMYDQGKNPREVGQKIMYSPCLIPTSYSKMRTAERAKISFSEEVQQIISFGRKYIKGNFATTETFIESLGRGEQRSNNKVVFKNVDASKVLDYLKKYKDADEYKGQISIQNWIRYIEEANKNNELRKWTIVLSSLKPSDDNPSIKIGNYTIYKASRSLRDAQDSTNMNTFLIKTNIDPTDFKEIFDPNSEEYKTVDHYKKTEDYKEFTSDTGLMSIYIEDLWEKKFDHSELNAKGRRIDKFKRTKLIPDAQNLAAPAIWFPKTKDINKSAVLFYVNKDFKKKMEEDAKGEDEDND